MSYWIQYPNLEFDEAAHKYSWCGRRAIGSTTLLSSVGVLQERKADGAEFWKPIGYSRFAHNETASNFGLSLHKVPYFDLTGVTPEYPEILQPWVDQYNRFKQEFRLRPYVDSFGVPIVEYPMYSERYKYAGMPDFFGTVSIKSKDYLAVVDWKTSAAMQHHWRYQLASYVQLCKEVFKIRQKIIHIAVRFDADKYETDIRINRPEDWIGFQSILNVYNMAA